MQDRELWIGVRRGLLTIVRAVEKEQPAGALWLALRRGLLVMVGVIERELKKVEGVEG